MKDFAKSLLDLWRQLGLNQRVSLVLASAVVMAGMVGLFVWSSRPDYQLLYGRLAESDTSTIISMLQESDTPHRVSAGGQSIYVPAEDVHRLRMELASKGLPTGEGVGFEIFDRGQFGLSDFVQRTNYNRALQGELARTISQLDGVKRARVLVVQPENRLLLTNSSLRPTASVFIERDRTQIEPEAVNSIRHLVANAVQGLVADEVAVVDQRGQVLSADLKEDPMLGNATSLIRYRQQVENYLAQKVSDMLEPVVGEGQAIVRVSADIDQDAVVSTEERFDPDSSVVRSEVRTEEDTATSEARRGGVVGAAANTPDSSAELSGGSPLISNEQTHSNRTVNYEINRVVSNITRNPGRVRSVTAAVFIAERPPAADGTPAVPRTQQELDNLRRIVVNALGLIAEGGRSVEDMVSLQEMPFQSPAVDDDLLAIQQQVEWQSWVEVSLPYATLFVALAVLFLFYRMLSRQRPEPLPIEQLMAQADEPINGGGNNNELTPELLNELIRQKPANVGTALRDWVTARKN